MGIPKEWETVDTWLDGKCFPEYPEETVPSTTERKFPDIPLLENYDAYPGEYFWAKFPRRELPARAETRINVKNLEKIVKENSDKMLNSELKCAKKNHIRLETRG